MSCAMIPTKALISSIGQTSSTTAVSSSTSASESQPVSKSNRKEIIAGTTVGSAVAMVFVMLVLARLTQARRRKGVSASPQRPSFGGIEQSLVGSSQQIPVEASADLAGAWRTELASDWICELDDSHFRQHQTYWDHTA